MCISMERSLSQSHRCIGRSNAKYSTGVGVRIAFGSLPQMTVNGQTQTGWEGTIKVTGSAVCIAHVLIAKEFAGFEDELVRASETTIAGES